MQDIPLYILVIIVFALFFLSAFFSGSETALMAVNRYRLRYKAEQHHRGARRVLKLLEKPDQLIALILLGNNLTNILIAQLTAYIGYRIYGEIGIAIATFILTFLLLIFAEMAPKTLAVLYPDKPALIAGKIYALLQIPFYPFVRFSNLICNGLLALLGVKQRAQANEALNREELYTAVTTAGTLIPKDYRQMLLGILELDKKTVEDIMVPRSEIFSINLTDPWERIEEDLRNTIYTRLPLCHKTIDDIIGFLHIRHIMYTGLEALTPENLKEMAREPYFIPKQTRLSEALHDFKKNKRRMALIVDEYGDVQGLVTIEDLLEEIIGEFTNDPGSYEMTITQQRDGSVIVDGSCYIRELNKLMGWKLNESGPKTINGLLLEHLESIPESAVGIVIDHHPFEVIKAHKNAIKIARILPPLKKVAEKQ